MVELAQHGWHPLPNARATAIQKILSKQKQAKHATPEPVAA